MKKVVSGTRLKEKMQEAINLLCDTTKMTLGPKGSNIIVDHSNFSPFITNDGVTIAENIESDDEVINTILEIAKEASIKTNELVGDGTTTTLVLLQCIFNLGLKLIEDGYNPILLKKELDNNLKEIIKNIKEKVKKPSDNELINIAKVSANDDEIGNIIGEVYLKIKDKNGILIKESKNSETVVNYINGYVFDCNVVSNYYFKDFKEIKYENINVLLVNNYLNDIEDIAICLNKIISDKKDLVIIANDYSEEFINNIIAINIDTKSNVILLKTPLYGEKQYDILKDLSSIALSNIIENPEKITLNDFGVFKNIKINKENVIVGFEINKQINNKIVELKELLKSKDLEEDFGYISRRFSMFQNGMAEILVGARTQTERREKKMRFDDALWAISSASLGVVPGSGITLLEISNSIECDNILKEALQKPFDQILLNAG